MDPDRTPLPADEQSLMRFATSLFNSLGHSSIKLYLSSMHLTSELKGPHDAVGSLLLWFLSFPSEFKTYSPFDPSVHQAVSHVQANMLVDPT